MRVLIVPKEFPTQADSQRGIFILRRVQAMQALGHDVRVLRVVPYAPPLKAKWNAYSAIPEYEEIDGVTVHTIRAVIPPRMIGMEYVPRFLMRPLLREIRDFSADLVHASFLLPCGQLAGRQRLVPSIVTAHGVDAYTWPFQRPGLLRGSREAVLSATRVTAVSGYIARCLQSFAPRDVDVIWNGADDRFFFPRNAHAARAELRLPQDRCIALYAGNVYKQKGVFDLLEALAAIPLDERPLLAVAGTGAGFEEFSALYKRLNVEVLALGRVSHERIALLTGACDMLVLPSWAEGLPNVVCEAMLSKRAVVGTTVGGIPEIVEDGKSGLLVEPRNPAALSNALRRATTDSDLRSRLAEAGHAFALANLTWPISARKYEAVYEQAISAGSPRSKRRMARFSESPNPQGEPARAARKGLTV